jgi:predicted homoserine dehydrogenase-like protein
MNLFSMMNKRAEEGNPVRIGMIGAGKFGTMFLSQVRKLAGIHLIGVADLSPANARSNMEYVGWQPEQFGAVRWMRRRRRGPPMWAMTGRRWLRIRRSTS